MATSHLLITGLPGVGKTTLIKKVAEALDDLHPVGFYTEEIRERGVRKGFALTGFDGSSGVLSHVDIKSRFRVGKYGVDVAGFEAFLEQIDFLEPTLRVVIIDEIGKMECFSQKFRTLLKDILNSEKCLVATIARKGSGIIEEIKRRPDATLLELKVQNRDRILSRIVSFFHR